MRTGTTPKLDENQDRYYSLVQMCSVICIPTTVEDLSRTGLIIEALSAESKEVVNNYYEVLLKTKMARDDESGEILDTIFDNRIYDLGRLYWYRETYQVFHDEVIGRMTPNLASFVERNTPLVEKAINATLDEYAKID